MKGQGQKVPFLFCMHRLYIKSRKQLKVLTRSQRKNNIYHYGCFRSMELANMTSKNISKREQQNIQTSFALIFNMLWLHEGSAHINLAYSE